MEQHNNLEKNSEQEGIEELSFSDKIIALITEPTALFNNLRIKPDWGIVLMIYLLFVLISSTLVTYYVTLPNLPILIAQNQNIPEEQKQKMLEDENIMRMVKISSAISGIITPLIFSAIAIFVTAFILYFISNLFGSDTTYKHHISLITYTSLINILGMFLRTPLAIIKQSPSFTISLAVFLPPEKIGTWIFNFLAHFDPFAIWALILVGIGFAIINEISKPKALTTVFGLWVIWLGIVIIIGKIIPQSVQ